MTEKPRDYSYEALAEATNCDMEASRGELNIALKSIRAQSPDFTDYALAAEIHRRARIYADVMGDEILLTPTALSKHWRRCGEAPKLRVLTTNQHSGREDCETCGGHRFVVVGKRKAAQTFWMRQRGLEQPEDQWYEEYAACPSCNPADASFFRFDGSKFRPPDPATVLERMNL